MHMKKVFIPNNKWGLKWLQMNFNYEIMNLKIMLNK